MHNTKRKVNMCKINFEEIEESIRETSFEDIYNEYPTFFGSKNNVAHSAFLNWRFDPHDIIEVQFFNMAESYFETAIFLLKECIKDSYSKKADIWIFPILFNIIHGIEIYLKGFSSLYTKYKNLTKLNEENKYKIEKNHDIKQLCQTVIAKIKDASPKTKTINTF